MAALFCRYYSILKYSGPEKYLNEVVGGQNIHENISLFQHEWFSKPEEDVAHVIKTILLWLLRFDKKTKNILYFICLVDIIYCINIYCKYLQRI